MLTVTVPTDDLQLLTEEELRVAAGLEPDDTSQDVALATRDLLASIIALRVERRPPFCAAFALWLSMIAALGLASRPACSRTAK